MKMEQERGISVTSSVMQFPYNGRVINLLDTPGHEDFSEDTYRTLTAVDSALMVIDCAKGVEERTIKLMEVCRLRDTPIFTFINKLDREGREPMSLLDEVEDVLKIRCAPVTWPIGMGRTLRGVYHLLEDKVYFYEPGKGALVNNGEEVEGLDNPRLDELLPDSIAAFRDEIELLREAGNPFDNDAYLRGELTPVYFGSAIGNFGVREMLNGFAQYAPPPRARATTARAVAPEETKFSGSSSKYKPTWTRNTATASPSCASTPAPSPGDETAPGAPRARRQNPGRTHLPRRRTRTHRHRRRWRYHRHPQPRHHPHRRHLHRRRRTAIHRHSRLRAGTLPPRPPERPAENEGALERAGTTLRRKGATPILQNR